MYITAPALENMVAGSVGTLSAISYGIKSSIYDPYPRGFVQWKSQYPMPDSLDMLIGNNVELKYRLLDDIEIAKIKDTDLVAFPTLTLDGSEVLGGNGGMTQKYNLIHKSSFGQATDVKKCYKDKRGDEIIKDVLDSNADLKDFERNLQVTDNSNIIYRSLGETDIGFIRNSVNPNFLIDNGCPLLFMGLDNIINYTSLNALSKNADNVQGYLQLGLFTTNPASKTWATDLINSNVVKDGAELQAKGDWKILTGGDAAIRALKPAAYFTDFSNPFSTSISKYTYGPQRKDKTLLPVNKYLGILLQTTDAIAVPNRPTNALDFEIKNLIGDAIEKFITIEATGIKITYKKDDKPIVVGDQLFVYTPYEYSAYNGIYTIIELEYTASTKEGVQANMVLARSHLDTQFVEMLPSHKDSEAFSYKFAPGVRKALLWDGK